MSKACVNGGVKGHNVQFHPHAFGLVRYRLTCPTSAGNEFLHEDQLSMMRLTMWEEEF